MVLFRLVESSETGIPAAVREQEQQRPPRRKRRPMALLLCPLRRLKSPCCAVFCVFVFGYRLRYLRSSYRDFESYNGLVRLWTALWRVFASWKGLQCVRVLIGCQAAILGTKNPPLCGRVSVARRRVTGQARRAHSKMISMGRETRIRRAYKLTPPPVWFSSCPRCSPRRTKRRYTLP